MVATSTVVTIGVDTVSAHILGINIRRRNKFMVSTCRVAIDNEGNRYGGHFLPGEAVSVTINGVVEFVGEVESANMEVDPRLYDRTWFAVDCRGPDHEMADLSITRAYPYSSLQTAKGDDIIEDALTLAGSTYTYTSPSGAPEVEIEFSRTFLGVGFRKICERINWDGYVDDSDTLHFFEEGSIGAHTAVDLISKVGDVTTNLLKFIEGEEDATTVKNYIEVSAGPLKDHYTEDSSDFTPGAGCSVADEYTIKLARGKRSIKISKGAGGIMSASISLPFGGYTYWNLSKPGEASFWVFHDLMAGKMYARPRFTDIHGNEIEFVWNKLVDEEQGPTEDILPRAWHQVSFPHGAENRVVNVAILNKRWYYLTRATKYDAGVDFTSANIDTDYGGLGYTRITLTGGAGIFSNYNEGDLIQLSNCENAANNGEYEIQNIVSDYIIELWNDLTTQNVDDTAVQIRALFNWSLIEKFETAFNPSVSFGNAYIDFLEMPGIEVIDIIESAASQALYNKRMYFEPHFEATSQTELEEINTELLEKRKWALKTAKAWAIGQTGSRYAALSLDVDAPPYGIAVPTKYRILSLHHIVRTLGVEGFEGENFITIYDLVSDELSPDPQEVQTHRFMYAQDPTFAAIEYLRERIEDTDKLDIPIDVHKFSRIPGDSELAGLVIFDTDANIQAMTPDKDGMMAFATDTRIWYGWTLAGGWAELTRAEVQTRLAQLLEKTHDSLTSVGNNDHHARTHGSRHETAAADPLDTVLNGTHAHSIAGADTDSGDPHNHPLTTYSGRLVEAYTTLYAASVSGGSPTTAFKAPTTIGLSRSYAVGPNTGSGTIHIHHIAAGETTANGGAHSHDVTSSPSPDLIPPVDGGKVIIKKITQNMVEIYMPEFDKAMELNFGGKMTKERIVKQLKLLYHREREARIDSSEIDIPTVLDWDYEDEKLYMESKREATFADIDPERYKKLIEKRLPALFGEEEDV